MNIYDAIRHMWAVSEKGETFSIKFIHCNLTLNEGGHIGNEKDVLIKHTAPKKNGKFLSTFVRQDSTVFNVYDLSITHVRFSDRGAYKKLTWE